MEEAVEVGKAVIPVLLDRTPLSEPLSTYHGVGFSDVARHPRFSVTAKAATLTVSPIVLAFLALVAFTLLALRETQSIRPVPGPAAVRSIEVEPFSHTFSALGDTVRLLAIARDANGVEVPVGRALWWSVSDPKVVTVDLPCRLLARSQRSSGWRSGLRRHRRPLDREVAQTSAIALSRGDGRPASRRCAGEIGQPGPRIALTGDSAAVRSFASPTPRRRGWKGATMPRSDRCIPTPRFSMRMVCLALFGLLSSIAAGAPALAEDTPAEIPWVRELPKAFAEAQAKDRPLMICINAKRVGIGRVEPAAKELRENTYRDPRVVKLASEKFVCALLTAEGTSKDYGELRSRYGIDGLIVSPQHVFAYPDGRLIRRKEYWPHGKGESSVKALLELMNQALAKDRYRRGGDPAPEGGDEGPKPGEEPKDDGPADPAKEKPAPAMEPDIPAAPEAGPERDAWIKRQVELAGGRDEGVRRLALAALVSADRDGDCVTPVLELLANREDDAWAQVDIVRALGKPGLTLASSALVKLLKTKNVDVRANAAVSLEYIGDPSTRSDLQRRAGREKETKIANHLWRAVGRCGAGETKARTSLATAAGKAEEWALSYGPIIGLAYFEKDKRAARAVEKLLVKVGPPRGGRRTIWEKSVHRALLVWCLAEIGDPKSADFMKERMIKPLEERDDRWVPRILEFYMAVMKVCRGDEKAMPTVESGIRYYLGRSAGEALRGSEREGRDGAGFVPKADGLGGG